MRPFAKIVFMLVTLAVADARAAALPDVPATDAARNAFAPTATRTRPLALPVTTSHVLRLRGQRLRYSATVSEWPVRDPDGRSIGAIVTQAYVARSRPGTERPVTFVYNGGPGAASWSLQMEGIGPRLYDAATGAIGDNPDSILDATDLVFIDPLGTGASFPFAGTDASSVWNTPGDARSIVAVIDAWLVAHHRKNAPQLLLGESYGTMRSLAVLHEDAAKPRLNVSGVMLLSLFLSNHQDDDLAALTLLPSLATTAYVHGARRAAASSAEQAYEDALQFARDRYAPALLEGYGVSKQRLQAVATEMSAQTGVPADVLEASRLRIDRKQFGEHLVLTHANGQVGSLDTRVVGGAEFEGLADPYNDPSMTLGKRPAALMERYLATLGYRVAAPYRPLNLSINNGNWYFRTPSASEEVHNDSLDATEWLVDAMHANPKLQLFTAGGYYDTATPLYRGLYLLDHAEIDRSRWTSAAYPAGHGIAEDPKQRRHLAEDLRAFIAKTAR
ncbi:hypothetical protein LMG31884_23000 [Xanthomonas hydrangeae]|nr:hypothetical protein LMG31884_23000 [Xanthomonas hydrangeae]CAD7716711.1 hypothetical protein LMG31884_23000 [Xanthomonas hydrangeae]CAD7732412.1 hypothetical protein LMG31887_22890 [Xanthomonas hydrangeae]CAD7732415.1 hypothetical protein LMG31887_22890 [Xanthomonas hydrangeae]